MSLPWFQETKPNCRYEWAQQRSRLHFNMAAAPSPWLPRITPCHEWVSPLPIAHEHLVWWRSGGSTCNPQFAGLSANVISSTPGNNANNIAKKQSFQKSRKIATPTKHNIVIEKATFCRLTTPTKLRAHAQSLRQVATELRERARAKRLSLGSQHVAWCDAAGLGRSFF